MIYTRESNVNMLQMARHGASDGCGLCLGLATLAGTRTIHDIDLD